MQTVSWKFLVQWIQSSLEEISLRHSGKWAGFFYLLSFQLKFVLCLCYLRMELDCRTVNELIIRLQPYYVLAGSGFCRHFLTSDSVPCRYFKAGLLIACVAFWRILTFTTNFQWQVPNIAFIICRRCFYLLSYFTILTSHSFLFDRVQLSFYSLKRKGFVIILPISCRFSNFDPVPYHINVNFNCCRASSVAFLLAVTWEFSVSVENRIVVFFRLSSGENTISLFLIVVGYRNMPSLVLYANQTSSF